MIQFNERNRIAFIASQSAAMFGQTVFIPCLAQSMALASNGKLEPVIIALESDGSEDYREWIEFVIRKDLRNDYMEAADFINNGNIDMLVLEHEYGCFVGRSGEYIDSLLRHIHIPVVSILQTIPGNPSSAGFSELVDISDASWKVIASDKRGADLLKSVYGISGHKIEVIPCNIVGAGGGQAVWPEIGWHFWRLASEQLPQKIKSRPFEFSGNSDMRDLYKFQMYRSNQTSANPKKDLAYPV